MSKAENLEPLGASQVGFTFLRIRNGIYEWATVRTLPGQPQRVVYIGSTCRSKPGAY